MHPPLVCWRGRKVISVFITMPLRHTIRGAIPLRLALVIVVFLVAAIAATVSFLPLYFRSLSSARSISSDFLESLEHDFAASIGVYFTVPQSAVSQMTAAARLGSWKQDDHVSLIKWLAHGATLGADSINIIFDTTDIWTAGFVTPEYEAVQAGDVCVVHYNGTHGSVTVLRMSNLSYIRTAYIINSSLNFRIRPYYPTIRTAQSWHSSFIGTSLGHPEAVLPCGAPIVLPNGTSAGAFYVRTRQAVMSEYFRNVSVAKNGRVLLFDPVTKFFIASNSDEPTIKVVNGVTVVTNFTDVKDPLLVTTVGALGDSLITCAMPCRLSFGSGSDEVFVTVSSVNDSFGLNKRLVIAVPSDDFLGEIRSATTISLIATATAVAILILLAVVSVFLIARPLLKLERKLYASAALREPSDDDEARSMILEIRSIEEAYERLSGELKKMKSFLPQSILELVDESESGEDAVVVVDSSASRPPTSGDVSGGEHSTSATGTEFVGVIRDFEKEMTIGRRRRIEGVIQQSLNFSCVLSTRRVTVVVCNVIGFHQLLSALGPMELHRRHCVLTEMILDHAKDHGGAVDTMLGDHFYVSWNAGVPRRRHVSLAVRFSLGLQHSLSQTDVLRGQASNVEEAAAQELEVDRLRDSAMLRHGKMPFCPMSFGVATGSALCGNFGCEGLKHPTIVGPVVHQAFALVHQCKTESLAILCNNEAAAILEDEMFVVHWDYVMFPQNNEASMISTVFGYRYGGTWTLASPGSSLAELSLNALYNKSDKTDESMRVLLNRGFSCFASGKVGLAIEIGTAAATDCGFLGVGLLKALSRFKAQKEDRKQ